MNEKQDCKVRKIIERNNYNARKGWNKFEVWVQTCMLIFQLCKCLGHPSLYRNRL